MIDRRQLYGSLGAFGVLGWLGVRQAAAESVDATPSTLERIQSTGKLRIAVVANQAPYFEKNLTTGEWHGFCLDMGRDIAKQMGVKLETLESTWGNSVLDLQANKIDMAFGLNPTPKRALVVDFPNAMFYNVASLVARQGFHASTWAELNQPQVRIAFDIGSSRETFVRLFAPKAQHMALKTTPECILAVTAGQADAFACSVFLGLAARKQNGNLGDFIMPTPRVQTVTTAAIQYDRDGRFRRFIDAWTAFNRGSGQVRQWILASLGEMGIQEADLPPNMDF